MTPKNEELQNSKNKSSFFVYSEKFKEATSNFCDKYTDESRQNL